MCADGAGETQQQQAALEFSGRTKLLVETSNMKLVTHNAISTGK